MVCTLLAAIVALGLINRQGWPRRVELGVGLFLAVLSQRSLLIRLFRTSILAPDAIPTWLLFPFLCAEAFLLVAAPLTVVWWMLRLCRARVVPWVPLAASVVLAGVLLWQGFRQPPIKEHSVALAGLPPLAEGLRVVVLADLHIDGFRDATWCARLVARVNALAPDVVVLTGDQSDGFLSVRREDLAPLGGLRASQGCFAVTGNHEWHFDVEALLAYYETLGIRVLDGRVAYAGGVWWVGVPDARSLTQECNGPHLQRLMAELPPDAFTVLLAHKPAIAETADALGVQLQFSGHTHGGQLPGVATLMGRFNRHWVRGWYTLPEGLKLFVAPGSGVWTGFPFRLYPSELSLVILHRAESRDSL